ncbi:MAG: MaoC family dehydratase [Candidatus Cyclobacteriaceae bacterium M3_2C_046]
MKTQPKKDLFQVGVSVSFTKTVIEKDIMTFAELTGDFSPNHVDDAYMKQSSFGKRIAHGALMVGYMSTASTLILEKFSPDITDHTPVSLGYDRVRFILPVLIDDTITVKYEVQRYEQEKMRSYAGIEIRNQHNKLVAVATHILKWVPNGIH